MFRRQKPLIPPLFLLFFISINFISCASISPASQERERPASFSRIENIIPLWQVYAEGIFYFHGRVGNPRVQFLALRIDLNSPEIEIYVSDGDDFYTPESRRVSGFVRYNDLAAGINAVPFDTNFNNIGIVISNGELLSPANPYLFALVFYKDGSAAIVSQAELKIEDIENAVSGFLQILDNGEIPHRITEITTRRPRSAAGISEDGNYLYLLVIDKGVGVTQTETALILRSLGSAHGINLDGGNSSSLALRFPDGSVRSVNKRFEHFERAVAGCLGIRLNPVYESPQTLF